MKTANVPTRIADDVAPVYSQGAIYVSICGTMSVWYVDFVRCAQNGNTNDTSRTEAKRLLTKRKGQVDAKKRTSTNQEAKSLLRKEE